MTRAPGAVPRASPSTAGAPAEPIRNALGDGSPLPSSFRDPSGFLFQRNGELLRQVNHSYRPHFDRLLDSGLLGELTEAGLLVRHTEVDGPHSAYKVLRPERIPFISYPSEWSFSQLRDAALTTLDIQLRALKSGMSLKDASAYNIQFQRGRPVLIDTLSFEVHHEGAPWPAYRQFCQHFLAPLALTAYRDQRLTQFFRVFMDGVPLDLASRLLPKRSWLRPSLAMHLHLHAAAQRRHAGRADGAAKHTQLRPGALATLITHLKDAIAGLSWTPDHSEWSAYYDDTNYTDEAFAEKQRVVARMIEGIRPASVWDLGANTGRFSRLASTRGILTVAFDVDFVAVDKNYLACRSEANAFELPLVMDLVNPTGGFGWAGNERMSLESRGPADIVMALALVHHLAISNNVPLERIAAYLWRLGRHLVIEWVPKTDSQVERLLASRTDIFDRYTRDGFERAFSKNFSFDGVEQVRGSDRVLYSMRRHES
jgi:ribosomal protein L11 methylase PrmA